MSDKTMEMLGSRSLPRGFDISDPGITHPKFVIPAQAEIQSKPREVGLPAELDPRLPGDDEWGEGV